MATNPAVTRFSTGVRIALEPDNPQRSDLEQARDTREVVASLLVEAAQLPRYQEHAERYEFRLRTVDGQRVLELKEKNWASKLKNVFSYSRRSDERKAAALYLAKVSPYFEKLAEKQPSLQWGRVRSTDQRMSGEAARSLVDVVHDKTAVGDVAQERAQWLLPEENGSAKEPMTRAFGEGKGAGAVDATTGLFQASEAWAAGACVDRRSDKWVSLSLQPPPSRDEPKTTGPAAIDTALKGLRGLQGATKALTEQELSVAKRNLVALLSPAQHDRWLEGVAQRYRSRFGAEASLDPQAPTTTTAVVKEPGVSETDDDETDDGLQSLLDKRFGEGDNPHAGDSPQKRVELEISFAGVLQITPRDQAAALAKVAFEKTVRLEIPWQELAKEDFDPARMPSDWSSYSERFEPTSAEEIQRKQQYAEADAHLKAVGFLDP